jgi:hypothetical protein
MTSPNLAPATYPPPFGGSMPPISGTTGTIPATPPRLNATPDGPNSAPPHAWSLGTTRFAQERPAARRKEECPPEVYIG